MKSSEQVIVILQDARCQIDIRRAGRFLLGLAFGTKSFSSRLLPDLIEMIEVGAAERVDIFGLLVHLRRIERPHVSLFEHQTVRKMSQ